MFLVRAPNPLDDLARLGEWLSRELWVGHLLGGVHSEEVSRRAPCSKGRSTAWRSDIGIVESRYRPEYFQLAGHGLAHLLNFQGAGRERFE